jgi:hypothetical protein
MPRPSGRSARLLEGVGFVLVDGQEVLRLDDELGYRVLLFECLRCFDPDTLLHAGVVIDQLVPNGFSPKLVLTNCRHRLSKA